MQLRRQLTFLFPISWEVNKTSPSEQVALGFLVLETHAGLASSYKADAFFVSPLNEHRHEN